MAYLYEDPDQVVFMDSESYEQLALPKSGFEGRLDLMTLNMQVEVVYIDGEPFDVELPTFVDLKVTETAAGVRGDTVSGGSKAATLESGAVVQVPLFIEPGDVIRVDTRTRDYVTRA
jgi:elongation factor P